MDFVSKKANGVSETKHYDVRTRNEEASLRPTAMMFDAWAGVGMDYHRLVIEVSFCSSSNSSHLKYKSNACRRRQKVIG